MASYESSVDAIVSQDAQTAVIPVGSLEQHGHHLPVNTDIVIAQALADRIGAAMDAYVLPCLPISTCREHMGKKGSVWMNPDTFMRMMTDICESLAEQGFSRIVIVQGHGGIFAMTPVLRQLNATRNPDLMVCRVDSLVFLGQLQKEGIIESQDCLHADEYETSMMLYLRPELVDMTKAVDFVPDVPRDWLNYGSIFRWCPDGVWGHATKGTAAKGERILERMTEMSLAQIKAVFTAMQEKTKFGYSAF